MRAYRLLMVVCISSFASPLQAADYPISGAWAAADNQAGVCASYLRNPKSPEGNIIVFKGAKKIEFNGG